MRITTGIRMAWVGIAMLAFQVSQLDNQKQAIPTSLQVILKPGQVYTLRFDKPLPVSGNSEKEKPPYREWMPLYVQLLDVKPRSIRFRTLTLQEALKEVERRNSEAKQWGGELVDPDFIRDEYATGAPFGLRYFAWSPPQGDKPPVDKHLLQVNFSIETPLRKAIAKKVRVGAKGLEIKPEVNHTEARLFLVPEGKKEGAFDCTLRSLSHSSAAGVCIRVGRYALTIGYLRRSTTANHRSGCGFGSSCIGIYSPPVEGAWR